MAGGTVREWVNSALEDELQTFAHIIPEWYPANAPTNSRHMNDVDRFLFYSKSPQPIERSGGPRIAISRVVCGLSYNLIRSLECFGIYTVHVM